MRIRIEYSVHPYKIQQQTHSLCTLCIYDLFRQRLKLKLDYSNNMKQLESKVNTTLHTQLWQAATDEQLATKQDRTVTA